MTTEQLPPLGGEDPIWDRGSPPPAGPGGKIAIIVGLLIVVALAGLGMGWLVSSLGGSGGTSSAAQTPSTSPSTRPSPSASATQASQIEAGRTADFGYFLSARTRGGQTHITFDRIQLLTGKAADAYAKAHHLERPVPNDFLIVNENPRTRDLVLGPEVAVTGTTVLANNSQPTPVSLQVLLNALAAHGKSMPLDVHYDKKGFVISVAERFFP